MRKFREKQMRKFRAKKYENFTKKKYGREIINYDIIKLLMLSSQSRAFRLDALYKGTDFPFNYIVKEHILLTLNFL